MGRLFGTGARDFRRSISRRSGGRQVAEGVGFEAESQVFAMGERAFRREEVLEDVSRCLWTVTLPKLLRPFTSIVEASRLALPSGLEDGLGAGVRGGGRAPREGGGSPHRGLRPTQASPRARPGVSGRLGRRREPRGPSKQRSPKMGAGRLGRDAPGAEETCRDSQEEQDQGRETPGRERRTTAGARVPNPRIMKFPELTPSRTTTPSALANSGLGGGSPVQ